eukprot:CAMPEP_0168525092 /NCGR_PEP_ID=MMETSP0405-20121227/11089_1 /TAXON_ID=498012 /ORGANISM="Trichosphaerium sp, Strain Am-I-7 wt" /LENGTH=401 /DNA_ID=CAMNT_0008547523 /DNA_START=154 /DNA_END=1356 /DNA_ORIENTATION=-
MATRYSNIGQLVTVSARGKPFKSGKEQDEIDVIENASIIVGKDGIIIDVGVDFGDKYKDTVFATDIDLQGKCVIPGMVDAHTHSVFSGDRVHEFAMKLRGATYMDIHKQGGGIGFTVKHTRQSSEEELKKLLLERIDRMVKAGTTLLEIKSGYGLETETEMKMLKVIEQARSDCKIDLVSTYLAHSLPKGMNSATATKRVLEDEIPTLQALIKNGELKTEIVDVFCEQGVFETADSKAILKAGMDIGLHANFHGDEINNTKSAEMAGEIGALAVSHLEEVSPEGIEALAKRPTIALVLPTTAYILKLKPPPARALITRGVPVAIASDYNPNAHCFSMPLVMNLACVLCGLTMNESLVAATLNAAASLGKSDMYGSLEVGKYCDFLVIDAPKWEHIIYQLGS